jgi:hypothetical protein
MGLFSRAKDRALEKVALPFLNTKLLAPYGRATHLHLDSKAKSIRVEVELNGENSPVEIEILKYEIRKQGDRYFALVHEIRTSREWLTTLAATQLRDARFELPAQLGRLLQLAL